MDSGNFAGALMALSVGLREIAEGTGDDERACAGASDTAGVLAEALGALSRQFTADTGVRVRMDISDVSSVGPLPPDVESELYRIASEALTNVQKHAGAREASLRLDTVRGLLRLIVSDAGVGFRVRGARRRGFGLVGIEDRAQLVGGRATIGSAPGRGTTVTVTVPLARAKAEAERKGAQVRK